MHAVNTKRLPGRLCGLALVIAGLLQCPETLVAQSEETIDFNRQIRPLLSDRCLACHGPDAVHREADLRLDDFEQITQLRDGRQVVRPGDVSASLLVERIDHDDPDLRMPPADSGKELSEQERSLLRDWIRQGAVWKAHWSYEVPLRAAVPEHHLTEWRRNWIDDFIAARLQDVSIAPSPDADPATRVRRLHLDLTGLPPSVEVVDQFCQQADDPAWSTMIDQLCDSDAHAERMAMLWLDLVRYADTVGYHGDQEHNISPYRDWVIDAFSQNMPFDQFTREQLAGDLLPNSSVDQKIASGYNRLLQTTHEGGLQPREYLAIYAADRVRNVSAVWMGATIGCAQCHDHKFDPYTSRDFYSLAAFFADIDDTDHFKTGTNALPTTRKPELKVLTRRERLLLRQMEDELARVTALENLPAVGESESESEAQISEEKISAEKISEDKMRLEQAIEQLKGSARLTMITSALAQPRTTRIFPRGNWLDESGPVVEPAVPEFFGRLQGSLLPEDQRATRLDLANWLTDTESGAGLLTARVMVNRLWAMFFGSGISPSLEDFGGQGVPPTHPELLDQLAIEFVDSGWNVRHIIRLIVGSRTYQQSSNIRTDIQRLDPGNQLLSRQSSFRLSAEVIRDNALAISGLLVRATGGASVRPYQPAGYYRHLNFPIRTYSHDTDDRQWRRGVYVHWQRQFLHPMLRAFDAPSREECVASRSRSNTPLAALTLLNDPTFVEAARAFAARLLLAPSVADDDGRIDLAFRMALSRKPDDVELSEIRELLSDSRQKYHARLDDAAAVTTVGLAPEADLPVTEHGAWTDIARIILNLDETVTRY